MPLARVFLLLGVGSAEIFGWSIAPGKDRRDERIERVTGRGQEVAGLGVVNDEGL